MRSALAQLPITQKVAPKQGQQDQVKKGQTTGPKRHHANRFSKKLTLWQTLFDRKVQTSTRQAGKHTKNSSGQLKQEKSAAGNILPLPFFLLMLQRQDTAQRQAAKTSAQAPNKSPVKNPLAYLSLKTINELIQSNDEQSIASSTSKILPSWMTQMGDIKENMNLGVSKSGTSLNQLLSSLQQPTQLNLPSSTGNSQPQSMPSQSESKFTDASFYKALENQISWMSGKAGNHIAQLQLHPPHLGTMMVQVKVNGHQTQILFQTQHALVKQTLEASIPHLREMMAQGGQQVSVSIQQQTAGFGQSGQGQQQARQWPMGTNQVISALGMGDIMENVTPLTHWHELRKGVVDTFV